MMTTTEDANKPLVIADDKLAEHWDVIQDEATREQSHSGLSMFGDKFPA
jgi:predicted SnoaL-like aldol condensation-catalyzing enzyme